MGTEEAAAIEVAEKGEPELSRSRTFHETALQKEDVARMWQTVYKGRTQVLEPAASATGREVLAPREPEKIPSREGYWDVRLQLLGFEEQRGFFQDVQVKEAGTTSTTATQQGGADESHPQARSTKVFDLAFANLYGLRGDTQVAAAIQKRQKDQVRITRLGDMFKSNRVNFVEPGTRVPPESIVQGPLGHCWFMAALQNMATQGFLVEPRKRSPVGAYAVPMHLAGGGDGGAPDWHFVLVDDRLPTVGGKVNNVEVSDDDCYCGFRPFFTFADDNQKDAGRSASSITWDGSAQDAATSTESIMKVLVLRHSISIAYRFEVLLCSFPYIDESFISAKRPQRIPCARAVAFCGFFHRGVELIVKAAAKLMGGYYALEGGFTPYAARFIGGGGSVFKAWEIDAPAWSTGQQVLQPTTAGLMPVENLLDVPPDYDQRSYGLARFVWVDGRAHQSPSVTQKLTVMSDASLTGYPTKETRKELAWKTVAVINGKTTVMDQEFRDVTKTVPAELVLEDYVRQGAATGAVAQPQAQGLQNGAPGQWVQGPNGQTQWVQQQGPNVIVSTPPRQTTSVQKLLVPDPTNCELFYDPVADGARALLFKTLKLWRKFSKELQVELKDKDAVRKWLTEHGSDRTASQSQKEKASSAAFHSSSTCEKICIRDDTCTDFLFVRLKSSEDAVCLTLLAPDGLEEVVSPGNPELLRSLQEQEKKQASFHYAEHFAYQCAMSLSAEIAKGVHLEFRDKAGQETSVVSLEQLDLTELQFKSRSLWRHLRENQPTLLMMNIGESVRSALDGLPILAASSPEAATADWWKNTNTDEAAVSAMFRSYIENAPALVQDANPQKQKQDLDFKKVTFLFRYVLGGAVDVKHPPRAGATELRRCLFYDLQSHTAPSGGSGVDDEAETSEGASSTSKRKSYVLAFYINTHNTPSATTFHQGLYSGHAYSFEAFQILAVPTGQAARPEEEEFLLIYAALLRNPHGRRNSGWNPMVEDTTAAEIGFDTSSGRVHPKTARDAFWNYLSSSSRQKGLHILNPACASEKERVRLSSSGPTSGSSTQERAVLRHLDKGDPFTDPYAQLFTVPKPRKGKTHECFATYSREDNWKDQKSGLFWMPWSSFTLRMTGSKLIHKFSVPPADSTQAHVAGQVIPLHYVNGKLAPMYSPYT
eukprot:g14175.t1